MICLWSSWYHCHPIVSCFVKSCMVVPFWCRLTQVVFLKRPLKKMQNLCWRLINCKFFIQSDILLAKWWPTSSPSFTTVCWFKYLPVYYYFYYYYCFTAHCLGLFGWSSARRNIHPLTPMLIIDRPLSASSIYCNPWHPSSSMYLYALSKYCLQCFDAVGWWQEGHLAC